MSEASEDGYELSLGTMAMNLTFAVVEKKLRERLIAPQDLTAFALGKMEITEIS